jgi:hypothetical protein
MSSSFSQTRRRRGKIGLRAEPDRNVGTVVAMEIDIGERRRDLDVDLGMAVEEAAPARQQPARREGRIAGDDDAVGIATAHQPARRGLDRGQRPRDVAQIELALRRQHQPVRGAFQQAHPQMHLELAHQPADRTRGHAEPLGRARETQFLAGLNKTPQAIQWRQIVGHAEGLF